MDNIVLPPIRPSCSKVATLNSPPSLLQVKQDSESIHNTDRFQHHMHVVDSSFVSVVRKTGLIPYLGYLEDEHIGEKYSSSLNFDENVKVATF